MASRRTPWLRILGLAACLVLLLASEAQAYVGPGAGFAFVTSFFLLLTTVLLTLLALLTWPLRALYRLLTRKRPPGEARAKRVVVVGLDGLDPTVARELMAEGRLPNFKRLAEGGAFGELATTCPAMSPVAWSSFATGVDPSRHGVFDFLTRDTRDYGAVLSTTEIRPSRRSLPLGPYRLPLGKPSIRMLRRGVPFWTILGDHGVPATILRVPITFPPDRFHGTLLSGMCVPDLLGSQGSYLYYSSGAGSPDAGSGGKRIPVRVEQGRVRTFLPGPPHPLRRDGRPLRLELTLDLDLEQRSARLRVGGQRVALRLGEYSDWVEVAFRLLPGVKLRGICRFRLLGLDPLRLYVTPLHIDPSHPAMPVAHPFIFSVFLSKLIGRYGTLGLAEDTGALNDDVIDEEAFLEQAQLFHREREQMFFEMLRRHRRGVCVCVFDITDRVQHMFMAQRGKTGSPQAAAIDELYVQMDRMLGRVLEEVDIDGDSGERLLVISDHGFAPFERGVNLNTWLVERGYMALEPGRDRPGDYLEGVDWDRTRAFALGLSGIYLNLAGREARGIVEEAEAAGLRAEIRQELQQLRDGDSEAVPIREVFDTHALYSGPFLDRAPDLIVGYNRGYRASWRTARGSAGERVIEPNRRHWSGDHCMDPRLVPGVLFSSGGLETGGAALADIAPTILELFGIPRPKHMTGRSLLAPVVNREVPI